MDISFLVRPVDHCPRQLAVGFYFRWYYVRPGVGVSTRRIGLAMKWLYTKQTFQTKGLLCFILSKGSDETFCCSKGKVRGHFNLRKRLKTACFQIHNGANRMWNWNTKINKSDINTSKFHLFMLSSNDWTVWLVAINLR